MAGTAHDAHRREPADLGILLTLGMRAFVDLLHARLDERGFDDVRPAYGVVFRALRDEPLTLTELATRLGVSKQAAAKVVDEMVGKRLVRRRPAPDDARAKLLDLAPRGRRAMSTAQEIGREIDATLVREAGAPSVDALHAALELLARRAGLGDDLDRRRSPALWSG